MDMNEGTIAVQDQELPAEFADALSDEALDRSEGRACNGFSCIHN